MNMAITYIEILEGYPKAEEMHRRALDGRRCSLCKEHEDINICVTTSPFTTRNW